MTYQNLKEELKKIKFQETRLDSEDSLEFVVNVSGLNQVETVLKKFFGDPVKPAGDSPTKEVWDLSESLGGVRDNQTLYYIKQPNSEYCAMIWPWSSRISVTIKITKI